MAKGCCRFGQSAVSGKLPHWTDLDKDLRSNPGESNGGISPQQVATNTLRGMAKDRDHIDVGMARMLRIASRIVPNQMLKILNAQAEKALS